MRFGSILLAALWLAGCGGDDSGDDDVFLPDATPSADAPAVDCANMPTLTFGRCELPEGGPCNGQLGEMGTFVPINSGDTLHPVVGFQGSTMFVLGIATNDIDLGTDPSERVRVNARLVHNGKDISTFNGGPDFYPDETVPGRMLAPSLFLIIFVPLEDIVGDTLFASADLTDRLGAFRCGEVSFVAGELVVP